MGFATLVPVTIDLEITSVPLTYFGYFTEQHFYGLLLWPCHLTLSLSFSWHYPSSSDLFVPSFSSKSLMRSLIAAPSTAEHSCCWLWKCSSVLQVCRKLFKASGKWGTLWRVQTITWTDDNFLLLPGQHENKKDGVETTLKQPFIFTEVQIFSSIAGSLVIAKHELPRRWCLCEMYQLLATLQPSRKSVT